MLLPQLLAVLAPGGRLIVVLPPLHLLVEEIPELWAHPPSLPLNLEALESTHPPKVDDPWAVLPKRVSKSIYVHHQPPDVSTRREQLQRIKGVVDLGIVETNSSDELSLTVAQAP
ncbi:MAG: hypothetical protein M1816_001851 [Peltula sp. TS41687]|nr:MAG: hypothetical protein M1816_001851 [Peltula sp. TS41687]